ncbi:MAG: 3-hydroxyacyl-ACP dehydratase FabZ [Litorimonas sp.]
MLDTPLPMTREQIQAYLPHRDPFLFIDCVKALTETTIIAESYVDPNLDVFKGHFPNKPIMPGVLLIETVAQAGALIIAMNTDNSAETRLTAFSSVESAKFRQPVYPEDKLVVKVAILRSRGGFYKFAGSATVNEQIVVELKFAASQISL